MVETIVFDIDGTLVDSVDLHTKAWCDAFAHFGIQAPFEAVRKRIGKGADELIPDFVDHASLSKIGDVLKTYRTRLFRREYLPHVTAFPKVRELFERLKSVGKRLALASSCEQDELQHYTQLAGIEALPDLQICSDKIEHSKPHPGIFEALLEKLDGPAPRSVVAIGDTPYDAVASRTAGLCSVGVLCGGTPRDLLLSAGCHAVFQDPADLLVRFPALLQWPPERWSTLSADFERGDAHADR